MDPKAITPKMSTYSEKLKDPRWQRRRLDILNRDNFTCKVCESTDNQLHVHHAYYVSGREPWEYPDWSLQTICAGCHKGKHDDETETFTRNIRNGAEDWEQIVTMIGVGHNPTHDYWLFDVAAEISILCNELGTAKGTEWIIKTIQEKRGYVKPTKEEVGF